MAACSLLLAWLGEIAYALEVTNDTSQIVHIGAMAMRALFGVAFVDMSAVVAEGVRDIESEVVTSLLCSHLEELAVLLL